MSLPTKEAVAEFLAGLGTTEDEVAASVRQSGVREPKGVGISLPASRHCIIAQLLRHQFPELNTTNEYWAVTQALVYLANYEHSASMSTPVTQFIRHIDDERRFLHYSSAVKPATFHYLDLLAEQPK